MTRTWPRTQDWQKTAAPLRHSAVTHQMNRDLPGCELLSEEAVCCSCDKCPTPRPTFCRSELQHTELCENCLNEMLLPVLCTVNSEQWRIRPNLAVLLNILPKHQGAWSQSLDSVELIVCFSYWKWTSQKVQEGSWQHHHDHTGPSPLPPHPHL